MRKAGICLLAIFICCTVICPPADSWADDYFYILNYSLKPLAYVSLDQYVKTKWDLELHNDADNPHDFVIKIVFLDKDKNKIKEEKKDCSIKANQTKTYSGIVLVEAKLAEQVSSTKVLIDDIK